MYAILSFILPLTVTVFGIKESSISYCTHYRNLCNPDYQRPCCDPSLKCSLIQPSGDYKCIKQVGLGDTCQYDNECRTILWHASCSSQNKCTCGSDAIQVGSRCEALIGGYCISNEQCTSENSVCINNECKCDLFYLPVAHNLCIRAVLGVPCVSSQTCFAIKNAVCSNNFCSCRPNTMQVSLTSCGNLLDNFCSQNDDCGPNNSICDRNQCKCKPNFARENNTQCNPPHLKMLCNTFTDCNSMMKHTMCSEEKKCECFPTHFPINETACMPYYESYCSDNDPCKLKNSVCVNNVCRCAPHHSYIGLQCEPTFLDEPCRNETRKNCKSLLKGLCYKNTDCYIENSICINNHCQCKTNYAADFNNKCVSKLEASCDDDIKCKKLYFQKCFVEKRNSFNYSSTEIHESECKLQIGDRCTLNEQCTTEYSLCINNRCKCKLNFLLSGTNDQCVSIYSNRNCQNHGDCGQIQNAICSDDKICVCQPNHDRINETICAPLLGQYCDKHTKCATDNAVCSDSQCKCDTYFSPQFNNQCLPTYLKQPCKLDDDCKKIKYAKCSQHDKCICRSNYIELNGLTCAPFIGGYCESDEECFINGSKCIDNKCDNARNMRFRISEEHPSSLIPKCQNDEDCYDMKSSKCSTKGVCICKSNYILVNQTICSPLLNEYCLDDSPCAVNNSQCIENVCQCTDHYTPQSNDKCLPTWLNEPCKNNDDCEKIRNAVCSEEKTCVCKELYFQFNETRCTSLNVEFCMTNNDCPVENSACIDNFCKCKHNFEKTSYHQCIARDARKLCKFDRDCDDINNSYCSLNGNCACKPNYVEINGTMCLIRSGGTCNDDTDCSERNGFCFERQCLCRLNYNIIDNYCIPISLGSSCQQHSDCSKISNSICSYDKKCVCKQTFYAIDRFSCAPKIGSACSNNNFCQFENSECYENSTCQCKHNYYAASEMQCLSNLLLPSCTSALDCGEPWHSLCTPEKKCTCKDNNLLTNRSTCLALIGGPCWRDDQCVPKEAVCSDFHCVCQDNYIAVANNLCVRAN